MREYLVKMTEASGKVLFLDPRGFWVENRYRAKLYAKGHATRTANIYSRTLKGITTEIQ